MVVKVCEGEIRKMRSLLKGCLFKYEFGENIFFRTNSSSSRILRKINIYITCGNFASLRQLKNMNHGYSN